jgi:succinate dehydrogenase (ubiquinone) cytochrome b560 subunit
MASSAHAQMKDFWKKNLELGRPNSPWQIYRPHLPMLTSLCHRMTGIAMGVVLYTSSIAVFLAPGDFPSYVEFVKNLHLSPLLLFPAKAICAFPLVYHYINGIRHLTWDAGYGYELKTQYKTGTIIVSSAILISALFASLSYW